MIFLLPFFFAPSFAVAERPHSTEPTVTDSSGLRRACSLSDLNRPNVARRILPAPPTNGNCFSNIWFSFSLVSSQDNFDFASLAFDVLINFSLSGFPFKFNVLWLPAFHARKPVTLLLTTKKLHAIRIFETGWGILSDSWAWLILVFCFS